LERVERQFHAKTLACISKYKCCMTYWCWYSWI